MLTKISNGSYIWESAHETNECAAYVQIGVIHHEKMWIALLAQFVRC